MDSRASFERLSTDQNGFLLHDYPPSRPDAERSDGERPNEAEESHDHVRAQSPAASSARSTWSAVFEGLSPSHTISLTLQARPGSEPSSKVEQHTNGENYLEASHQSLLPGSDATPLTDHQDDEKASDDAVAETPLNNTAEKGYQDPATWRPYALKPRFLCLVSTSAFVLCLTVTLLSWMSARNHGLGNDDGSSIILFGWRFTPSLIAVLYVQLTFMVLDGAKSTEPFSRLATPGGSPASYSLLQRPGAWWNALADGLSKKKNDGRRSWLLVSAAVLNIIGFLGVSPFSSALLLSKDVSISEDVSFSRMGLPDNFSLPLRAGRETYLRTIGHILQNASTSAWISDEYTILPFWPSEIQDAPLGPFLSASSQTWQAETLVLQTTIDCISMSLVGTEYMNDTYYIPLPGGGQVGPLPNETASITLQAEDGCSYTLALGKAYDFVSQGGASWSETSFFYSPDEGYGDLVGVYGPNTSLPDQGHVISSPECRHRELIFMTTPWSSSIMPFNFSSDLRASGSLCTPKYHMAQIRVDASMTDALSEVKFDKAEFDQKKVSIPDTVLSLGDFSNLTLNMNWAQYFAPPKGQTRPNTGGLSTILATLYDFDISAMLDASDIVSKAAMIRGRFFGEVIQYSLSAAARPPEAIKGQITETRERIVVQTETSIVLAILLFISFCLSLFVLRASGQVSRPLNLNSDPATAIGIASLVTSDMRVRSTIQNHGLSSRKYLEKSLEAKRYRTDGGVLEDLTQSDIELHEDNTHGHTKQKRVTPGVIRVGILALLIAVLLTVASAILVLYSFARRSLLYRRAFIYETTLPLFEKSLPAVSAYSIMSTLIGIGIGMWWGVLDETFRRLQPFLSMTEKPTPLSKGAALSYRSIYWSTAAWRAASKGHWILCLVTLGTCLCPILTISMSALFQQGQGTFHQDVAINRRLELRQVPLLFEVEEDPEAIYGWTDGDVQVTRDDVLGNLFTGLSADWMYGAIIQLVLNGSHPAWSQDGWSFVPLDLSSIDSKALDQSYGNSSESATVAPATTCSVSTPALRARIECKPSEETFNPLKWLEAVNVTNPAKWNVSVNPTGVTTAYGIQDSWAKCCTNATSNDVGDAAFGFWSQESSLYALGPDAWPVNFTTRWIHGNMSKFEYYDYQVVMFTDVPSVNALRCLPIIETAETNVTVDIATGQVNSYTILEAPTVVTEAWDNDFTIHLLNGLPTGLRNCTTSYGTLFEAAVLSSAAMTSNGYNYGSSVSFLWSSDQTYNIRDETLGVSLDFMTYAMYSLANKDPQELLDASVMESLAQTTFQVLFQHFVSSQVSMETGGWAYQPINYSLPADLAAPIHSNISRINDSYWNALHPNSKTNRTAIVRVNTPIELLQMNTVAVILSVTVIGLLVLITIVISILQHRHLKGLKRNIECIADILVLVCGSDKLLGLLRERGVNGLEKDGDHIMTKLGWFQGADDELRWGIEIVEPDKV